MKPMALTADPDFPGALDGAVDYNAERLRARVDYA